MIVVGAPDASALDVGAAGLGATAVAIGKFDGVHVGHRRVLARLRQLAVQHSLAPVAVTFDRHPLALLRPDLAPAPVASLAQRLELLEAEGVAATVVLAFDEEFSRESPEEFVDRVLVGGLDARLVLVGADFRFGHRGAGDVAALAALGRQRGFDVEAVEDVIVEERGDRRRASSTWVRELLDAGDVAGAARVLGRPHRVRSIVVRGAQRGRALGYPTANLDPAMEGYLPGDGVYAVRVRVRGGQHPGVASVGNNPTFRGVPARQAEAHVFDESFDIYGEPIEVEFVELVRPMRRFDDVETLVAQMHEDARVARAMLGA
ncbi:MAG: bifunctional riboflavin kinase/FAD synthetase [Microbacteriaceae bacterium]